MQLVVLYEIDGIPPIDHNTRQNSDLAHSKPCGKQHLQKKTTMAPPPDGLFSDEEDEQEEQKQEVEQEEKKTEEVSGGGEYNGFIILYLLTKC